MARMYFQSRCPCDHAGGKWLSVRTFTPEEYLPSVATANRMMAPTQRATADIVIVDPGAHAVGYTVYPCLPQVGGLVCEDELRAAPKQP